MNLILHFLIKFTLVTLIFFGIQNKIWASDTLRILSWNTMLIPKAFVNVHNDTRITGIANTLKKCNKDVIMLQEFFSKRVKKILLKELDSLYPYHYGPSNGNLFKLSDGVMILSKYPIIKTITKKFKDRAAIDRCSNKGVMVAWIQLKNNIIQFTGTHMQSKMGPKYDAIRKKQLNVITQTVTPHKKPDVAELYMGDFNIHQGDSCTYSNLLNTLIVTDDEPVGEECFTINPKNNLRVQDKYLLLDYILFNPNKTDLKVENRTIETFTTVIGNEIIHLSDHFAISADLIIP